jgi:hypothetical protein
MNYMFFINSGKNFYYEKKKLKATYLIRLACCCA